MLDLCWCEDSQSVKWFKMSSHSECFTELYNLIRHVLGNWHIYRSNKLDLQSCWKDMKFCQFFFTCLGNLGPIPSKTNKFWPFFQPNYTPCDVRSLYWLYINPTLWFRLPHIHAFKQIHIYFSDRKKIITVVELPTLLSSVSKYSFSFPNVTESDSCPWSLEGKTGNYVPIEFFPAHIFLNA